MAGRRHHTIPQFILKAFAHNPTESERYTWFYRKSHPGLRVNIKNVGVEKDFYGKAEESDLDAVITRLEPSIADLIEELRSTQMSSNCVTVGHQQIPELVSHMVVRTRQLRQSMMDMPLNMMRGLADGLRGLDICRQLLLNLFVSNEGVQLLRKQLTDRGLGEVQVRRLTSHLADQLPAVVENVLPDFYPTYLSLLDEVVRTSEITAPQSTRAAHLASLSHHISQNPRSEKYSPFTWTIMQTPKNTILGDSVCVFETNGKRRFKPLDSDDEEVRHIFFPLSPSTMLVGHRYHGPLLVDLNKINKAIASCSYEFFVSAEPHATLQAFGQRIGTWSGLLSRGEVERLISESLLEMIGPRLIEAAACRIP